MKCRCCGLPLQHIFADLIAAPPSNAYLTKQQLSQPEIYYPLKLYVCDQCWLVQIDEFKQHNEIFDDNYAYFSSYSSSWLAHSKTYVDEITEQLLLNQNSLVIEIAANDGYLLQYFNQKEIPNLGIEPTASTAQAAREKGISVIEEFFGVALATQLVKNNQQADLILGNNVLAHVPDINDFVSGLKLLLKEQGTLTFEFPHLMQLVKHNQFDTIYHEHFSYFSLHTIITLFNHHQLNIVDVKELPTHGGSLRIYAQHQQKGSQQQELCASDSVKKLLTEEKNRGMLNLNYYAHFQQQINQVKNQFLQFLLEKRQQGKTIAAYGAAAKGNTLLNYCGIKKDLIDFVVDISPHKQDKYLPGSHIPIVAESYLKQQRPDYIIIFPWNIQNEIKKQLSYIKDWGGQFVIAVPELRTL